jgi:hypothetical protein
VKLQLVELGIALIALGMVGVGLWMKAPWLSLVVVGGLVLSLTVAGKLLRRTRRD